MQLGMWYVKLHSVCILVCSVWFKPYNNVTIYWYFISHFSQVILTGGLCVWNGCCTCTRRRRVFKSDSEKVMLNTRSNKVWPLFIFYWFSFSLRDLSENQDRSKCLDLLIGACSFVMLNNGNREVKKSEVKWKKCNRSVIIYFVHHYSETSSDEIKDQI